MPQNVTKISAKKCMGIIIINNQNYVKVIKVYLVIAPKRMNFFCTHAH